MCQKLVQAEVGCVKGLSIVNHKKEGWSGLIEQSAGVTYYDDSLICVKGIGKKKYEKLVRVGLVSIRDLTSKSDAEIDGFVKETKIRKTEFLKWRAAIASMNI